MLTLWDPFRIRKLDGKNSIDDLFDSLFDDAFSGFKSLGMASKKAEDGSLLITVDVPGIKEEDLTLELQDNTVVIKGERKTATASSSMNKMFSLPEDADPASIKAELKDGILTLTVAPKALPSKDVKKIPILTQK